MRFLNFSQAFCQLEIALECKKKKEIAENAARKNAHPDDDDDDDEWNYNQQTLRKQKLKVNIVEGMVVEGGGRGIAGRND